MELRLDLKTCTYSQLGKKGKQFRSGSQEALGCGMQGIDARPMPNELLSEVTNNQQIGDQWSLQFPHWLLAN
jgi:hypothetical protein